MFVSIRTVSYTFAAALFLGLKLDVANAAFTVADRPWLDPTRSSEERLQLFMLQLNATQKYATVQGDTVVSIHQHIPIESCVAEFT